jgi:hypothetical protein
MDVESVSISEIHTTKLQENIEQEAGERAQFQDAFNDIPLTGVLKRLDHSMLAPEIKKGNPDGEVWNNRDYWMARFFRVILKRFEVMKAIPGKTVNFMPK